MFTTGKGLITPPDETRLWRYMNLSAFLQLLLSGKFYFCLRTELADKWEGVLSATVRNRISTASAGGSLSTEGLSRVCGALADKCGILCWHMNDCESIAMWDLYTNGIDGVAISTTMAKLKRAMEGISEDCFVGKVEYTDHLAPDANGAARQLGLLQPLFQKRKSYSHECEVRAIISPLGLGKTSPTTGTSVGIDLTTLIERIVVSRHYPEWGRRSLQKIVNEAGLTVEVEKSDLQNNPGG